MLHFPTSADKFRLWKTHDLRPERILPFYRGLRPEDHEVVWNWIEEHYLSRYARLYRVDYDWLEDGVWYIPFPGSLSIYACQTTEDLGLTARTAVELKGWCSRMHVGYNPEHEPTPQGLELLQEGLEVAKLLRTELDPSIYLEFNYFREIVWRDGQAIELPVPAYLQQYGATDVEDA